jgi:hypothetical protein
MIQQKTLAKTTRTKKKGFHRHLPANIRIESAAMASLTANGTTGCTMLSSNDLALTVLAPRLEAMVLIFLRVTSLPATTDDWNELLPWVSTAITGTEIVFYVGSKWTNKRRVAGICVAVTMGYHTFTRVRWVAQFGE